MSGLFTITFLRRSLLFFKTKTIWPLFIRILLLGLIIFVWWRDVNRERVIQGFHFFTVQRGLILGFITFIFSEVLLFFSFFWVFFHFSSSPALINCGLWPSWGIIPINPFQIPLLNTLVLLRSGVTVTLAHHQIINNNNFFLRIVATILLGIYFTFLQLWEYSHSGFSIYDSNFGRIFFLATGFHGGHVLIGTIFLFVNFLRINNYYSTFNNHYSTEIRIYYWHFVDVVWLFLYSFVYWWRF